MAILKGIFDIMKEEKTTEKKLPSILDLMKKTEQEVATQKLFGKRETGFELKKAPKDIGVHPVTELLKEKPIVSIAKAQVSYNISQKTGIDILEVEKNLPAITKQLGTRGVPTSEEMLTAMFAFPVTAALISNPITAGIGVGKFLALTEAENYVISKLTKAKYKVGAGKGLKELLPEDTVQLAKDLIDVADFIGKGYVIAKTDPHIMKIWEKFSKDIITTYNMPKQVFISAEKVKSIFQTGKKISAAESQLITDLGLTATQYKRAIKDGINIQIPSSKLTTMTDKPYWAKIKSLFNVKSTSTAVMSSTGKVKPAIALIEGKVPTIPTVVEKGLAKPRETREQLVDKLTKKDADKAPIVKAVEDAKAKFSDETEAKIKVTAESPATRGQITRVKFLVAQKGLLTPSGKQKAQHKAFLKALTGEDSITKMNQGQVQLVIDTLDRWHPKTVRAVYETPVKFVTKDLVDMIQGFREIGLKEDFRDAYHVWQKIGLVREIYEATEKAEVELVERMDADTKIALQYEKATKDIPDSDGKIFRKLNNTVIKGEELSAKELETVKWLKSHFDKWADDLKLPPEKRRKHYITNIIEEAIVKDLKVNKFLNVDFLRAMEYGPGAKEIFHPYLQARRGLKGKGVKESWISAFQAYEGYSARKLFYDPILQKISLLAKFLPPNAEAYAKEYKKRMTGELSNLDKKMNFTLREMGTTFAKLPGGEGFAKFLMKGNPAGTISYHAAGLLYVSYLGLMPRSAIRNASQSVLTVAETGAKAFLRGGEWLSTPEGKKALKECVILRQRRFAALPELNVAELRGKLKTAEDAALYLFKFPDIKFSVPRAFGAGYVEARDLGLPHDQCIRRGNEVARKCQYAYSKMASSLVSQSSAGRVLGVFTTWPRNFLELGYEWVASKPSQVYLDYKKDTGIDVIPESETAKRAAMLRYIAMVALASVIERKTSFRATEYTGWTSLRAIPRILSGDLAGIQIPGGTAQVMQGLAEYAATGDPYLIKKGWEAIRPDKQVLLIKSLKDVFDGKKDWLDLLLYLEKGEGLKKYPRLRK